MAKRNRTSEFETESEALEQVSTELEQEVKEEVTDTKDSVESIEAMSDEQLLEFMRERKRKKSEAVAIKEVKVPMYKLVKVSAVPVTQTEDLQNQINRLTHEVRSKK